MRRHTVHIMKSEEIAAMNEANMILRHFVNLSAKLLPFLDELTRKSNPSNEEIISKHKIESVFNNYNFDTKTSEMLIGSNVLELIKSCFDALSTQSNLERSRKMNPTLVKFLSEYQRLSANWHQNASN